MASGDGLLVRLRPRDGAMDADAAHALATAASRFGNGTIQLTSRGLIQLRGLSDATLAPFADAMARAGFSGEVQRVVVSPLAGEDPAVPGAASRIAARVAADLEGIVGLPAKFAVAVDGGGVLPLGDAGCDIVVRCDDAGCDVLLAGAADAARVAHDAAADVVWDLACAFVELARPPVRRMRTLVEAIGAHALFTRIGLTTQPVSLSSLRAAVGWLPYGIDEQGAFGLGLPFGAMQAAALASLATELDGGILRVTPWRAFALTGAAARRVGTSSSSFIIDYNDPRAAIFACPGCPACASATVAAREDAEFLAAAGLQGVVHVSGCEKGCAYAQAAPVALVGRLGRYDLVRDGRASDAAVRRGLTLAQAIAALRA
jgi:precorrin-3B synthase